MARVRITEYRAKKIIIGRRYSGIRIAPGATSTLPRKGRWIFKVDQGIKQRFKKGLVAVVEKSSDVARFRRAWEKKGYSSFLLEPYVSHEAGEERYISFERVRGGLKVLYTADGGVHVESAASSVSEYVARGDSDSARIAEATGLPHEFLEQVISVFNRHFFSFLEINPLVVRGSDVFLLDAAVLVDSAGAFFLRDSWDETDIIQSKISNAVESRVAELQLTTSASLKLKVLNKNGSLFFLLSGGGGSIVIADEASLKGFASMIGNYGEYSGGPTREETYLYAREVVRILLASRAKKKALVIAGGIANFTDVKTTFAGIIDALSEVSHRLKKQNVEIFVRRGGPNETEGLSHMRSFLEHKHIFGSIAGSDAPLTEAVDRAIEYLQS